MINLCSNENRVFAQIFYFFGNFAFFRDSERALTARHTSLAIKYLYLEGYNNQVPSA